VERVVIRPGDGGVEALVVRRGLLRRHDVIVPIDAIEDAEPELVRIRLSRTEVDQLPEVQAGVFVAAPAGWKSPGGRGAAGVVFAMPAPDAGRGRQRAKQGASEVAGQPVTLAAGQTVIGSDGEVGTLALLLLDSADSRVTHLVVRGGKMLEHDTIVPLTWVRTVAGDQLLLDVGRAELSQLPEYRSDDDITADVFDALWYGAGRDPGELCCVEVQTVDGIVTLRGTTRTEDARRAMEQSARCVRGVLGVRNELESIEELVRSTVVATMREQGATPLAGPEASGATMAESGDAALATSVCQAVTAATAVESLRVGGYAGTVVLRGTVADAESRHLVSERAREVAGVRQVINLVGIAGNEPPLSAIGYGYAWLHALVRQATGLDLDEAQATAMVRLAERKLADLFDVAKDTALANGREVIFRHDLPLTKGLRRSMEEVAHLTADTSIKPVLSFLADVGVGGTLDDAVRSELPRLTAALLVVTGRIVAIVNPTHPLPTERLALLSRVHDDRPTAGELERAARVLDLTL
jgi:osmotically-inducible protein OsmY